MRLLALLLIAIPAFAGWDDVARIGSGDKVEIATKDGKEVRGTLVSVTTDSLVMREKSADRTFAKTEIQQVRVYDPGRRIRHGIIFTLIGTGLGAGGGTAACLSCFGEGSAGKFAGPGAAVGAAIGALGFLTPPYRAIYKGK